jgi:DNA polymerase
MTYLGPIVPPSGPSPCRIAFLGEAPGEEESEKLLPFVGPSGQELRRMCRAVGIDLRECYVDNVFNRRPPSNNLAAGYSVERTDPRAYLDLGPLTSNPATFLDRQHLARIVELHQTLAAVNPNIIVALGNTAMWALGLGLGVTASRGSVHVVGPPILPKPTKILPTFHPAMILRQWDQRTIGIADLEKALAESETPDLRFDNTQLWLDPTLDDLDKFGALYMEQSRLCATDVETRRGQITCVSFSPRPDISLAIPFWVDGNNPNYWPDVQTETRAWRWVARWVEDPAITKVTQNGLYDIQYFIRHGIKPRGFTEDTMLQHHSLYSEMRKGLGFLGSIYANVPSWKQMRTFKRDEIAEKAIKRDE